MDIKVIKMIINITQSLKYPKTRAKFSIILFLPTAYGKSAIRIYISRLQLLPIRKCCRWLPLYFWLGFCTLSESNKLSFYCWKIESYENTGDYSIGNCCCQCCFSIVIKYALSWASLSCSICYIKACSEHKN